VTINQGYVYRQRVSPGDAGANVLAFHVEHFEHSDEDAWRRAIEDGRVRVNGRVAAADELLRSGDELEFLITVMGRGTRALAQSRAGDALSLIGPLGNGWPALSGGGAPWVMLGGGVGSAPFYLGIEQALAGMDGKRPARREELVYLYGAARRGLLYDLERFRALGVTVHTATDDGSEGFKGNVLGLLDALWSAKKLPREVRLLACGPHPMLVAVERLARAKNLECWLSLETLMGCGVGICNGCPVATRPEGPMGSWPNAKCCVEGPVFPVGAVTLEHPGEAHGSPRHAPPACVPEAPHEPERGRAGN